MLLFSHIPKCGGKSLLASLEDAMPGRVIKYYSNPMKRSGLADFAHRTFRSHSVKRKIGRQLANDSVVYGHFTFDDFQSFEPVYDIRKAAFFRDPVEWVGSFVFYMSEKYPGEYKTDVPSEIRRRKLQKAYRKFLGKTEVSDLQFVGIVEDYSESMKRLAQLLEVDLSENRVNITQSRPDNASYREHFSDLGIIDEVADLMSENQAIYDQASVRFGQQAS